jgi:flagellar assembly protein FliH
VTGSRVLKQATSGIRPATLSTVEELVREPRRLGGPLQEALEAATQQGYADGFARGEAEGRAAGEARAMQEFTELLEPALRALEAARAELARRDAVRAEELEGDLLRLAVDVAEAVLGRELEATPGAALDAVRRALQLAPARGAIAVHLHPADVQVVDAAPSLAPGRTVELVADAGVARGDAVLRVGACTIDAQVAPALDRVRAALALDAAPGAEAGAATTGAAA